MTFVTSTQGNSGGSSAINFPNVAVTTDDMIVVGISTGSGVTSVTMADTLTNTYTPHSGNGVAVGAIKPWLFRARANGTNGALAIVATFSGADAGSGAINTHSGILTSAELDVEYSGSDSVNVTSHTGGSAATNGGNVDLVGFFAEDLASGTAVHTAGSGWTKSAEQNDANSYATCMMQYQAGKPQGTYANNCTTSASSRMAGLVFALKNTGWTSGSGAATLSAATPSGTLGTATSATLGCTTDTASGTLYGVVDSAANISGITAAQIKLGQNKNSVAAVASGNSAVSTTTPSIATSGLSPNTAYSYAEVQNTGADSNVVTGTFTTAVVPPLLVNRKTVFVDESIIQF